MKAHLLFRDRDPLPPTRPGPLTLALVQDLDVAAVLDAMGAGDAPLREAAERVLLANSLSTPEEVLYRQQALEDCLGQPAAVRELYRIVVDALERERQIWGWSERSASSVLYRSLGLLEGFLASLRHALEVVRAHRATFRSAAFRQLFASMEAELDARFFAEADAHLRRLESRASFLLSATVGRGAAAPGYVLRTPPAATPRGWRRLGALRRDPHTIVLADRDETGHRLLGELIDRGLTPAAAALGRAADHMLQFLRALRTELGFYVGALNLHERLRAIGAPVCFPDLRGSEGPACAARGLYDVGLALRLGRPPVPNDLAGAGRRLVLITGANQGGKSTLLRAVGLAQLLGQAGLFVGAESLSTGIASGIFTHFRREEDPTLRRGKLEEELARMQDVCRVLAPGGLLLCNESLSSTNEREGSEIADQVVRALVDRGITVVYVTFLFEFADAWRRRARSDCLFLRAERTEDGARTFRLLPGEPEPWSFAEDVCRKVWDLPLPAAPPRAAAGG